MSKRTELSTRRVRLQSSIAARSFLAVLALFSVLLVTLLSWAVLRNYDQERAAIGERADRQTRFLATVSPEAILFRDFLSLETLVRNAVEDPAVVHSVLIDTAGSTMTRFADRSDGRIEQALEGLDAFDGAIIADRLLAQEHLHEVRLPVVSEGVRLGEIRLVYSTESARSAALDFLVDALLAAAVSLGAIAVLTLFLFRWQLRQPLQRLTEQADAIRRGEFDCADEVGRADEIGVLQQAFNRMANELATTLAGLERARDDAQQADRAKSEFLANMSHEIRTPLNAVLGFGQLLLDSDVDDRQRELLTTMHQSGDALLMMLNQLLDYSKLENGSLEIDSECFDLHEVVSSATVLFSAEVDRKRILLEQDVDAGCPQFVVGDEARVRQVVVNLIGNAVKFTDRGSVRVGVSPVIGTDRVRFDVVDTGIGIDPMQIEHLFEPFQQGDSSTTRRFGGAGLGLAICRRLVLAMGGIMEAGGEVGKGSRFSFELPLPAAPTAPRLEPVSSDPIATDLGVRHPLRVLVAEDNPVNRMVATSMFERLGYEIDLATDGVEAVDMAVRGDHDLVLMDIQMPRMDGVEAARRIRSLLPREGRPRIVAFTAHALAGDRERYLATGMNGYVTKPMRLAELAEVLTATRPRARVASERPELFDLVELQRLLGDDAQSVLDDLLPMFRADATKCLDSMRRAIVDGDSIALGAAAHALRGSASSLAATSIATRCGEIERLGGHDRLGDAEPIVEQIGEELTLIG